jgi:hypothetical protein
MDIDARQPVGIRNGAGAVGQVTPTVPTSTGTTCSEFLLVSVRRRPTFRLQPR